MAKAVAGGGASQASDDEDSAREDSENSDSDEFRTPRRGRRPALRRDLQVPSDTEAESEAGEWPDERAAKKVRMSPETELMVITPLTLTADEAIKIFFKAKLIHKACSYGAVPDDSDDEEEQ